MSSGFQAISAQFRVVFSEGTFTGISLSERTLSPRMKDEKSHYPLSPKLGFDFNVDFTVAPGSL